MEHHWLVKCCCLAALNIKHMMTCGFFKGQQHFIILTGSVCSILLVSGTQRNKHLLVALICFLHFPNLFHRTHTETELYLLKADVPIYVPKDIKHHGPRHEYLSIYVDLDPPFMSLACSLTERYCLMRKEGRQKWYQLLGSMISSKLLQPRMIMRSPGS